MLLPASRKLPPIVTSLCLVERYTIACVGGDQVALSTRACHNAADFQSISAIAHNGVSGGGRSNEIVPAADHVDAGSGIIADGISPNTALLLDDWMVTPAPPLLKILFWKKEDAPPIVIDDVPGPM